MRTVCGVVCGLLLLVAAPAGAQEVVLGDGHVDYAARMVAGQLRGQVKDGTQGADRVVWREPESVVLEVRRAARGTIPNDARLAFLGAPGSSVWVIPQVQRAGILWAGWNTEELGADAVGGPVTWTLRSVRGPGSVAIFQTGAFGAPDVLFDSADGLPDSRAIPLGTHAHGNWAFSRAGDYELTFELAASGASGAPLSDTRTLRVRVEGDAAAEPTATATPSPGAPGQPRDPAPASTPPKLALRASGARLRGRTLSFSARLSRAARVDVRVRHGGRVVTRARTRTVAAATRARTLRVRLGRAPRAGRTYRVAIRARAGGETVTRTLTLRLRRPRAAAASWGGVGLRAAAASRGGATARAAGGAVTARRAAAGAAARAATVTIADGHVDAGSARIVGGRLRSEVKDATKGRVVWRDPASVVMRVVDRAKVRLPAGTELVGRRGQTVWMIPQVQKPGVIWAGWNTEEIRRGQIRGAVDWTLRRVSGPGRFVVFQTGTFGAASVIFDSARRLPQTLAIAPGVHAHGNWAFTRRGTYRLRFAMRVTTAAGQRQTANATLTFRVG